MKPAVSIIGIKKTIKQHTADVDITDSVDYKISAPPRFYNRYLNLVCYRDIFIFDGGNKRLRNVTNLYCQCQISQRRS
jgi:hypothetical protein